jgi:Cu+-exporting ATPase
MVKAAQMSKPPIGRLVDRIAAVFVPIVIAIALLAFAAWLALGPEPRLAFALTTAIAVLVIACPCALGLATPIAIMVGTSRAAQANVLIRNSDGLQSASTLTHVVVDKTGTLTEGRPAVTVIRPAVGRREDEVLQFAASLESGSEHPLAEAVLAAQRQRDLPLLPMDHFVAVPGRGVEGQWQGGMYLLGNDHFLEERGVSLPGLLQKEAAGQAQEGGTPVWLAGNGEALGLLILKDPVRADSAAAVQALQRQGITVVMCTGDNRGAAAAVAREVGIGEVHSEILPEAKLEVIRSLQAQGFRVGMVGDGVNDAPALAQADTGFAVGSGTDVAIEHADITLIGDSLLLVATAIAISTATLRNIKQNLFGAFFYNVIGIPLAAGLLYPLTGWLLDPMFASAAMALSSVTVVTNANRLRFFQLR